MKWILHKNGCVISEMTRLQAGYPRNRGSIPAGPKAFSFLLSVQTWSWSDQARGKGPEVKLAFHPTYCRRQVRLELFLHSPYAFQPVQGRFACVLNNWISSCEWDWSGLRWGRVTVCNDILNSIKCWNFYCNWATISFSSRTVLGGVSWLERSALKLALYATRPSPYGIFFISRNKTVF
jgi:hypothetical protein